MELQDMTATFVARMTPAEAEALRDSLDGTSIRYLPGASDVGIARAVAAYNVFRSLLTAKITEGCAS